MKILTVTWKIFDAVNGNYVIHPNGGAVMISDICEYIGRKEESFLFQGSDRIPNMHYGHISVLGNDKILSEPRTSDNIEEWQFKLKDEFRRIVREYSFDFVFFHGTGNFVFNCIKICKDETVPFAVVMHGNFMTPAAHDTKEHIDVTSRILSVPGVNVITVSHGSALEFLQQCSYLSPRQMTVIVNGIPNYTDNELTVRRKQDSDDRKTLLCSGTLSIRKNQIQLVRAFSLLPLSLRNKIQLVLCGKDSKIRPMLDNIHNEITRLGLEENISYIGTIPKTDMPGLYNTVDGLVSPSLMEGLSLVVLEAIQHGKPAIMFADNETASDVNSPDATILVKEHSDQALADAIVEWYERDWDQVKIKEYSKNFTIERVADEYIAYAKRS